MSRIIVLVSFAESLINFRGRLLREMVEKGHKVLAFAPEASLQIQDKLNGIGVEYRNISIDRRGLNPIKDLLTICRLVFIFRKESPDMILGYTIKPVIYGSLAGRIAGVPHIFSMITGLGYTFSQGRLKEKLLGAIVRFLYKMSIRVNTRVFFQNPDDRDIFRQYGLLRSFEQAVLVNGSGVDVDVFHPVPFPENISFLLIARLIEEKGIPDYVKAARIVKDKHPQSKFRLVGWIDEGPNVISKPDLDSWVKDGTIEYLGKLDDVRTAITNTSVYVLPSYHEGTPRTVLEAMSMGRPIITTDAPGCRETVNHGENGFLVPVRDPIALAEAMERFIKEPELIPKMGKRSREIAEEKYDVNKVNAVILKNIGLL